MKRFFILLSVIFLLSSPAFAVQTGGAGSNNPDIIKGADIQQNMLTVEGTTKSQTIEVTTGITKIGTPTYTWPSALGSANTYLKHGSSGTLTWEGVPGASAAGSTGQIQFNRSNTFDASANLTWDASANNRLFVAGTVEATYFRGNGGQLTNVSAATAETAGSAGYAATAGSATSATTAETAGSSGYATTAGSATSATTAETAGSATPSGAAGGDLTGTYPNPTIGNNKVVAAYMATDSVTSGAIAANAVTTDEIAAGSVTSNKLASDFTLPVARGGTGANIYPTGEVLFGNGINSIESSNSLIWTDAEKKFEIYNEGLTAQPKLTLYQIDADGGGDNLPLFVTMRFRGSLSEPTNTQNGDFLGGFIMGGQKDSDSGVGAGILAMASENWTDSAAGTDLYLASTAQGTTLNNPLEKSVKLSGGIVTIPTLPPSLYVKTTADKALTAEAINLSSGMTGTLGIQYGGTGIASYPSSGEILIGDGLNNYSLRLISGDVSMNYVGNIAIKDGIITNDKISGDFVLPILKGGTGTVSYPGSGEILVGPYMPGLNYAPRTMSGDVTMGWTGITTISNGAITYDKLASDFILPVARGGTSVGDFTGGGLVFASTTSSLAASSNLTWDASANNRLFVTGTVEASYFRGNGGQLTDVIPSGNAGGDLAGTYPNPTIGNNKVVAAYMATDSVTSGAIAANAVATNEIADGSITGPKLADQITKIGIDNSSAYNITLSNEGTGGVIFPDLALPMTGAYTLRNTAGFGAISQIGPGAPNFQGATVILADPGLLLLSPNLYLVGDESIALSSSTGVNVSIGASGGGGLFKVLSDDGGDPGVITDLLTVNDTGVVTAYSLPPSLYVKTTSSHALTAEAINLSSGMTGTLGIQYGGTGTAEYPGSGEILVGDGLDNYSLRIISGDVSMNHLGSVAIRDGVITADKMATNFVLPLNKGGTGVTTYNYYGVVYPGPSGLMTTLAGPLGTVLKGTGMMPAFGQVVTAEIAAASVTTETIADNSITGPKFADQIVKSGALNGAAYTITLSNEGTGDSGLFPLPVSNGFLMNSSGHWGGLFQLSSASPLPGAIAVFSDYFSVLGSGNTTKVTGTDVQLSIDTAGGQLSILNEAGDDPIDLLTVDENGVTTITSLPPSLYVKTTATHALTAEAIDLSSGMTGTLQVAQGGTSVGSFTQHGVLYATTATSLDATTAGASGTVLKGTGTAPEFGQVTTLEVANGAITGPKLASNINITTSGNISATSLEVSGKTVYTPSGTNTIVAAEGITIAMITKKAILVAGDGAGTTDISVNPQIAAGQNGQEIVLIGTSDTNLVKLDNGNGLQLSAATSFTLGAGDIMQLIYVDSIGKWVEISRTDN